MKPVEITEVVDIAQYEKIRTDFRNKVLAEKEHRRVAVGPSFSFLFENRLTVLYQVQEMMRTERIVEQKAIAHEVLTYNELIPPPGGLGATLLVEYSDPQERAVRLVELLGIEKHIHLQVADLPRSSGEFDQRQMSDEKISSVQYLQFKLEPSHREAWLEAGDKAVVRLICDHPAYTHETVLSPPQLAALAGDLTS